MSGPRSPDPAGGKGDHLPAASLEALRARGDLLAAVREFFRARGILEVETPVLCAAGAVDEHLEPIPAACHPGGDASPPATLYLVTSPEHSMKRLLAAGSGPIYQVTRAFRDGERGRLHNPEFTIIEWYRPGFDHTALMEEVESIVRTLLARAPAWPRGERAAKPFQRTTYREAFERALGMDPHRATAAELFGAARGRGLEPPWSLGPGDRDALLNLLLSALVEPKLGVEIPEFLIDWPASQAALARIRPGDPPLAERFELHFRGLELANGYHELIDHREQARRFMKANARRRAAGKPELPIDRRFLAALESGLPACAGVALGFDRIAMLAVGASSIDDVLAFPVERA